MFPIKQGSFPVLETTVSINHKNVFRGFHVESFAKLVTCIQGKVLDIVVNFDEDAEDYLIPSYYELDATTAKVQVLVKPNHGHAFLSLEDNTILLYHFAGVYDPINTVTVNYRDPSIGLKLPIPHDQLRVSFNDQEALCHRPVDYYVVGGNGFIGSIIMDSLKAQGKRVYKTLLRLEQLQEMERELDVLRPKYVICSAGLTGTPNIQWCETHQAETIETNIVFQMTLVHLCRKMGVHLTVVGSGVIFTSDRFYGEDEEGNYAGNFYGKCRIIEENMIRCYENVLYLRVNYPISSHKSPKNLITKLLSYDRIQNVNLTLTYLDELVPHLSRMIEDGEVGVCNFVNDGSISLWDVVDYYSMRTGKTFAKPMNMMSNASRSASLLKVGKMAKYGVSSAHDAVHHCIDHYLGGTDDFGP